MGRDIIQRHWKKLSFKENGKRYHSLEMGYHFVWKREELSFIGNEKRYYSVEKRRDLIQRKWEVIIQSKQEEIPFIDNGKWYHSLERGKYIIQRKWEELSFIEKNNIHWKWEEMSFIGNRKSYHSKEMGRVINYRKMEEIYVSFIGTRTHQYPDLLLSVSVNYHVAGAGDAYVTSESIFCKLHPY